MKSESARELSSPISSHLIDNNAPEIGLLKKSLRVTSGVSRLFERETLKRATPHVYGLV
jgi:hypothetical protein